VNRYLKDLLVLAVPATVLGLVLAAVFRHEGGPLFTAAVVLLPGFWFSGFIDEANPMFWLAAVAVQAGYYLLLLHLYFIWQARRVGRS
jgi:hypothetical protein